MHKAKLKKLLREAGILEQVEVISGSEIEVFVEDKENPGRADADATEALKVKVREAGINWGGYCTGYGSWVLREGYEPLGDWNDPSSKHHY